MNDYNTDDHPSKWAISYDQLLQFDIKASRILGYDYDKATMRDINERIIIPDCRRNKKSYALSLNPQGLKLDAFITHCWDEPFKDFVVSIQHVFHAKTEKPNLWICAFALRQDNCDSITELLLVPLPESPFVLALRYATDFVVVRNANTDLYSRIWCVCELMYAKQFGLIPHCMYVTGPDVFSHVPTSCLEAKATNDDDARRIIQVLLREHNVEEIDALVLQLTKLNAKEMSVIFFIVKKGKRSRSSKKSLASLYQIM